MKVFFLRHGQSQANLDGVLAGQFDTPLTDRGVIEAKSKREAVAALGLDRVYCSDLSRASVTARLVLRGLEHELVQSAALRERAAGSWRGRDKASIDRAEALKMLAWDQSPPGGETPIEVGLRATEFLAQQPRSERALMVTHLGLMGVLIYAIDQRFDEPVISQYPNLALIERTLPSGGWAEIHERFKDRAAVC